MDGMLPDPQDPRTPWKAGAGPPGPPELAGSDGFAGWAGWAGWERGPSPAPDGASSDPTHVLLVEDNPGDAVLIREYLSDSPGGRFHLDHVSSLAEATTFVSHVSPSVILLDLMLPDSFGIETVVRLQSAAPRTPIVVLTGYDDEDLAVRAVQARAQEYLLKGEINLDRLTRSIRQAIERHRLQTEVVSFSETLAQSASKFREVISQSADGILVAGTDGRILFANPAAGALFGREAGALLGETANFPLSPERMEEIEIATGSVVELRVTDIRWEGEPAWLVSLRDISAHRQSEAALKRLNNRLQITNSRLERLAYVDPLTELLNRRGLERLLAAELNRSKRTSSRLMACLVDCDDFKRINESCGHAAGDQVLREVGHRMRDSLRPSDHIARVGGDEFLVLLPDTRIAEGRQVGERLLASVAGISLPSTMGTMGGTMGTAVTAGSAGAARVTVSIGVAAVPPSAASIEDILQLTDAALRSSKSRGKNLVTAEGADEFPRDSDEFLRLLSERGLRTVGLPIFRLSDERAVALELLCRGPAPLERPLDLFGACTGEGLRTELDLRCLETNLRKARELGRTAVECFHVNLLPSTLLETTPARLLEMFPAADSPRFCVEISDQQLVGQPAALQGRFAELRRSGIRTALDDVGFGRTALETLILLEPDFVKLDPNFVQGASRDVLQQGSLRRLVTVCRALGSELIAEGIDSRGDLELLKALGVPYGQGFLWGEPRPL